MQGVFLKNLDFALNVAVSAKDPEEPRNSDSNPSTYRVKPTVDIDPTPVSVSYGATQTIEAVTKKSLGSVVVSASISGTGLAEPHVHHDGDAVRGRRAARRPAGQGVQAGSA